MEFLNELYLGLQSMKTGAPIAFYAIIFSFAASFATFLNVVIYRTPFIMDRNWCEDAEAFLAHKNVEHGKIKRENALHSKIGGRSYCPSCNALIPIYYNIPILGSLMLRGKTACCRKPILFKYFAVEIAYTTGVMALFWAFPLITAAYLSAFLFIAISIAAIDMKTTFIPDHLTYLLLWIGLAASTSQTIVDMHSSILGAIIAYVALAGTAKLYQVIRGTEGMGAGDFKLIAAIAAWTGIMGIPYVLLGACALTILLGIFGKAIRKIPGLDNVKGAPFGPGLVVSGFVYTVLSLTLPL